MKKTLIILVTAIALCFAQELVPEKIAVYAYGASDAGINKSLGNKLIEAMVRGGKYVEIANSEAFYEDIAKNGNSQIAQTAKHHGADYVCTVSIAEALGSYSFSVRMVRTSDSQILKIGSADRSLKSMDDLTAVSNELASQFLPQGSQAAPLPLVANAQAAATQKQCVITFNINEIIFKIKNGFANQLKDCSVKLAKETALASSPFGKKSAAPEPKAFMKQCAVDWIKKEIADEFPNKNKLVSSVENFVGSLDPKKIDKIDIEGLLSDIKKLATGECVVATPYEPPITPAPPIGKSIENEYIEIEPYQNFTRGQRWGTWALNLTINGLGSWLVMDDVLGASVHFVFGVCSLVPFALASWNEEYNHNPLIGVIFYSSLISGGIWNWYRSSVFDKPQNVANKKYEGFNFAVLPNKRGELMPYVFYGRGF